MPNQYVEMRHGGYYVAGTRIGSDVLVYDFREGRSAEDIFTAYPLIGWNHRLIFVQPLACSPMA